MQPRALAFAARRDVGHRALSPVEVRKITDACHRRPNAHRLVCDPNVDQAPLDLRRVPLVVRVQAVEALVELYPKNAPAPAQ